VAVVVNGVLLDLIHIDHTGSGHVSLNTLHYQKVPELNHGDTIDIVDASDGTLILEGVFGPA
jgi:hypothetical protein